MEYEGFNVGVEGRSTVRIEDKGFTVTVDPTDNTELTEADIVLVTGEESFDPNYIEEISKQRTCVVTPSTIDKSRVPVEDTESIEDGETIDIYGVEIEALESTDGVGYRFRMRDHDFYVPGKSELTDRLMDIEGRVDLAFLPVNGELMDVDEAVKAAVMVKPSVVVPYFEHREVDLKALEAELKDRNIGFRTE